MAEVSKEETPDQEYTVPKYVGKSWQKENKMCIDGHGYGKTRVLPSDVFKFFSIKLRIKSFGENRQEQMRGARWLTKMEEIWNRQFKNLKEN